MFAAGPPATVTALITGVVLCAVCTCPKLRQMRTQLAAARWLAEHDPLTGLANRSGAHRHHRREITAGRATIAVLIDLDDFKTINDNWGHQTGDAHLTAIAQRLTAACTPHGALASRLGGDEFLVLIPRAAYTAPHDVLEHVTAILTQLGKPMTLPIEGATTITTIPHASAGIAVPEPATAWADLLRHADIALYHAKTRPGHAVLYTPGMRQPARDATGGPRLRERNPGRRYEPTPEPEAGIRVEAA
jgi:diguanylate cyclase (GGDEF)-like protein